MAKQSLREVLSWQKDVLHTSLCLSLVFSSQSPKQPTLQQFSTYNSIGIEFVFSITGRGCRFLTQCNYQYLSIDMSGLYIVVQLFTHTFYVSM